MCSTYLPARLTALSYALLGDRQRAWRSWHAIAPAWPLANAGPVMAAGAGAGPQPGLRGIRQHRRIRPPLGEGRPPRPPTSNALAAGAQRLYLLWLALAVLATPPASKVGMPR